MRAPPNVLSNYFSQIDPLTKFLWAVIIAVWLTTIRDLVNVTIVSLMIAVFAVLAARFNLRQYGQFVTVMLAGGVFLVVYQGFFRSGQGVALGPIVLSYSGMSLGLAISFRTFGLVASSLAFSTTTYPKAFELSLIKIGIPYRLARICYLSLRLLPLFRRDLESIRDAQQLRGIRKGWDRTRTALVALVAVELLQADDIAIALETRGFGLYDTRTELEEVRVSSEGRGLIIGTLILIAIHTVLPL